MDKIGIIILHYKNNEDTLLCLESVIKSKNSTYKKEIIVIANSDEENFVSYIKKNYPLITIIPNKVNGGFAQGNNLGLRWALSQKCFYFILLNNDTVIAPDLVIKLLNKSKEYDDNCLISPKIYFARGYEYQPKYKIEEKGKVIWYAGGILDWKNVYAGHRGVDEVDIGQFDKEEETDFVTGCCLFLNMKIINSVGFLNEKYFLYFEDVEYSLRAKKQGFKLIYYPKTIIWHKNAGSSGKPGSDIHLYYQTRNRLYLGMKNAPFRTKKSLLIESFRHIIEGGVKRKAVFDFYFNRMGKGSI